MRVARQVLWSGILVGALGLAGCVSSDVVVCEDGRVCAAGASCVVVVALEGARPLCVSEDAIEACRGLAPGGACGASPTPATCHDEACLPDAVGNGLLDATEVCDDGARLLGGGCSADCQSDETCGNGVTDPVRLEGSELVLNEQCDDGAGLAHDGCSGACEVEQPRWTTLSQRSLVPMTHVAAASDALRGRVVLFGGHDNASVDVATSWSWEGVGWRELAPLRATVTYHVLTLDPRARHPAVKTLLDAAHSKD